jgi:hypothetical protein
MFGVREKKRLPRKMLLPELCASGMRLLLMQGGMEGGTEIARLHRDEEGILVGGTN